MKMQIKLKPNRNLLDELDFQAVPKAAIVMSNATIFNGIISIGNRKKLSFIQSRKISGSTACHNLTTTSAIKRNAPENKLSEITDKRLKILLTLDMNLYL
jgi:fructose-specific phosphotransferase system IIC component